MADGAVTDPQFNRTEHIDENISAKRVAGYIWDGSNWVRNAGTYAAFSIQIDVASSTVTYIGKAVPGTATSSSTWQIKKIDSTSGTSILFASGNSNFDKVYDNRASLSYS
jgi:hypothetical protein